MDKLKHSCACLGITLIVGWLTHPAYGAIVAIAAGIGKEIYDKQRGGKFDLLDIAADGVGAGMAMLIFYH